MVIDEHGKPVMGTFRYVQGDVGTKTVRVVCRPCNHGWMREIVDRAKPYAAPLLRGDFMILDRKAQIALADWIALAALMSNQITKSKHNLAAEDVAYFYENKRAPPHWFVGISYFVGIPAISFDHSLLARTERSQETNEVVAIPFVQHSFSSIIGSLFTLVHVAVYENDEIRTNASKILSLANIAGLYGPNVFNIQPGGGNFIFPPHPATWVVGPDHFEPMLQDGPTHAFTIANRVTGLLKKVGDRSERHRN